MGMLASSSIPPSPSTREWMELDWSEPYRLDQRLEASPDSGFLGYTPIFLGLRKGAAMQYWRSLEDLQRFATDPNGSHVPVWKWYNEEVDSDEGLGFWAELYIIDDDSFKTFFRNVPPTGVGKFARMIPMREHERRFGLSPDGSTRRATSTEGPLKS